MVGAGAVLILYCYGTDVIQLAGLAATIDDSGDVAITAAVSGQMLRFNGLGWVNEDGLYDVGIFIPGTHGNGALLAQVVLTRAVSVADDFAGARAYAGGERDRRLAQTRRTARTWQLNTGAAAVRTRYGPGVSIATTDGAEIEALAGSNPSFAAWGAERALHGRSAIDPEAHRPSTCTGR